ncbi:MAG: cytochrome c [Sandaracinaceae bacterium]|nr:cytochrome c [Sandaracinaceae bacterium]
MNRKLSVEVWSLSLAGVSLFAWACDGGPDRPGTVYMPEMFESVAYDSHDPSPVLPRGQTLQAPPEGTIPQGFTPVHYAPGAEEAAAAGQELTNPFEPTEEVLARGRFAFETWCAVCHGARGNGDGPVVPPFPPPPNLSSDRTRGLPDGHIYHIITRGQGLMPSYSTQVREDDRWKIIHYIRQLQGPAPDAPAADAAAEPADAGAPAAEPGTEPPATEQPATEPPATEPPATEPPATQQPATEPAAAEPAAPAANQPAAPAAPPAVRAPRPARPRPPAAPEPVEAQPEVTP